MVIQITKLNKNTPAFKKGFRYAKTTSKGNKITSLKAYKRKPKR